ncbi:MAG: hypothetical protein FWF95_07860 [Syntrophorhabdaceae bacterium]|nr:hypothetical protein [Syntrophorhabdaceae bacterium]
MLGKVFGKDNDKSLNLKYPFIDAKNIAAIICCHVIKDNKPILYVSHDADDGMWQFLCGGSHEEKDAMVVSLHKVYLHDTSVSSIATLPLGGVAERKDINSTWQIYRK